MLLHHHRVFKSNLWGGEKFVKKNLQKNIFLCFCGTSREPQRRILWQVFKTILTYPKEPYLSYICAQQSILALLGPLTIALTGATVCQILAVKVLIVEFLVVKVLLVEVLVLSLLSWSFDRSHWLLIIYIFPLFTFPPTPLSPLSHFSHKKSFSLSFINHSF